MLWSASSASIAGIIVIIRSIESGTARLLKRQQRGNSGSLETASPVLPVLFRPGPGLDNLALRQPLAQLSKCLSDQLSGCLPADDIGDKCAHTVVLPLVPVLPDEDYTTWPASCKQLISGRFTVQLLRGTLKIRKRRREGKVKRVSAEPVHTSLPDADAEKLPAVRQVQDAIGFKQFNGYLLHRVSTEVRHKPQWLEIELWKVTDGTGRYVLHFTGKSVLVHKYGSDCNTGVPTAFSELSIDAESCRKCRPDLQHALPTAIFEAETDRHKAEICDGTPVAGADEAETGAVEEAAIYLASQDITPGTEEAAWYLSARKVLWVLRDNWHRKPGVTGTLSAPAQRLIDTVETVDPAIYAAVHVVEEVLCTHDILYGTIRLHREGKTGNREGSDPLYPWLSLVTLRG
jgi:hypothetical protein